MSLAPRARLTVFLLTTAAMIAFAANSVLCRLALHQGLIDAASFTAIRGVSGAVTLAAFALFLGRAQRDPAGNWRSGLMLFIYLGCFSFAYQSLATGTGALILFGAVQLTMFLVALARGESFSTMSWLGLIIAIAGLVYLVSPGLDAPDPLGAVLMTCAGIAWGFFSLLGRLARDSLAASMRNFAFCVPLVGIVALAHWPSLEATFAGIALALASGAITSACGYVIWFAALPHLTSTRAATVQLSVPAVAALGGVALLAEPVTLRLVLACIATLGGVAIVVAQRSATTQRS